MMQVTDLKLKEEVLPFFDFTNNESAADRLLSLLCEVPATEVEVLDRHAVTQGFIDNWSVLDNFTYRRIDLMEVHAFLVSNAGRQSYVRQSKFRALLKLMASETDRNRARSRLVQTVMLLRDIQVHYLLRLNKDKFPENFRRQLQSALSFLSKLNLNASAEQINNNRFNVSSIIELSQRINCLSVEEVNSFWDFFFSFEAFWSIAKGTLAHGFTFPHFTCGAFRIIDFYHPLVSNAVKNTLEMDAEKNVLLLTGPNMSGKSTLLKAVSLCVYLARVGFPVPASLCAVPFYGSIAIAINLSDSLRNGYSHFKAEIENLKSVLHAIEDQGKCFAVFDEIFRGTNVDDALDITQTTVNGLVKRKGSFFLLSTHLLQLDGHLNSECRESVRKCYIECSLEEGIPKFSYTLKEGWSQLKIGKILFEKEGLAQMLSCENKNATIQQHLYGSFATS
jgi:DNA mismatch repair protein MutS